MGGSSSRPLLVCEIYWKRLPTGGSKHRKKFAVASRVLWLILSSERSPGCRPEEEKWMGDVLLLRLLYCNI